MAIQINLMQFLCVEWEVFSMTPTIMTPSSATRWSSAKPVKPTERWADKVAKQMSLQQKFKPHEEKKPQSVDEVKAKLQVQNPSMQAEALPKEMGTSAEKVAKSVDRVAVGSTEAKSNKGRYATGEEMLEWFTRYESWKKVTDRERNSRRRCVIS